MKNSNADSIEGIARYRNGVRPDDIVLGEDTEGTSHVYRTFDETILIVQNGELIQRFNLDEMPINNHSFFTEEAAPHAHRISYAIGNGGGEEDDYWLMVTRDMGKHD